MYYFGHENCIECEYWKASVPLEENFTGKIF